MVREKTSVEERVNKNVLINKLWGILVTKQLRRWIGSETKGKKSKTEINGKI